MLEGRIDGTAFYQCYTTCQPEHGVPDHMSADQARLIRDSRGMPEFVYNPRGGETHQECLDLKGNPSVKRDWWEHKYKSTGEKYNYTVAHWAITDAASANTSRPSPRASSTSTTCSPASRLDVTYRNVFKEDHVAYVPDFGVYFKASRREVPYYTVGRQMVLFAIERRKAWRMLQSKAGVENKDGPAQKVLLEKVGKGDLTRATSSTAAGNCSTRR